MRYVFVIEVTISLATEVEASSLEQAIEVAQSRGVQGLCHQCSSAGRDTWNTGGEIDCDPVAGDLVDLHVDGEGEHPTFETACARWSGEQS